MWQKSLALFLFCAIALPVLAQEAAAPQKVVYHISEGNPAKQVFALISLQNHIDAVGAANLDLRVVVHGDGLSLLLNPESLGLLPAFRYANADPNMAARIDGLRNQGVRFLVCRDTMERRGVDLEEDLYNVDEQDLVRNGIEELISLQLKGYVYIKP